MRVGSVEDAPFTAPAAALARLLAIEPITEPLRATLLELGIGSGDELEVLREAVPAEVGWFSATRVRCLAALSRVNGAGEREGVGLVEEPTRKRGRVRR